MRQNFHWQNVADRFKVKRKQAPGEIGANRQQYAFAHDDKVSEGWQGSGNAGIDTDPRF